MRIQLSLRYSKLRIACLRASFASFATLRSSALIRRGIRGSSSFCLLSAAVWAAIGETGLIRFKFELFSADGANFDRKGHFLSMIRRRNRDWKVSILSGLMMRILAHVLLLSSVLLSLAAAQTMKPTEQSKAGAPDNAKFLAMADQFVKESLVLSPVNASQAGYHKHLDAKTGKTIMLDAQLDDVGVEGMAAQLKFYRDWRQQVPNGDAGGVVECAGRGRLPAD